MERSVRPELNTLSNRDHRKGVESEYFSCQPSKVTRVSSL